MRGGSSNSERAVALLRESGYDARALKEGFPGWRDRGYPVEKG